MNDVELDEKGQTLGYQTAFGYPEVSSFSKLTHA